MLLTAPLIHNGYTFLPEGSVIETTDEGIIIAIYSDVQDNGVIEHPGILCPGFVNTHCHLELSHMKDMIPEHTGLIPFLQKVPTYRTQFTDEQIKVARHDAHNELLKNGIVAVGDIANVADTRDLRVLDKIHFHTFIECIGFTEQHAKARFEHSEAVYQLFARQQETSKLLRQSIVPHAPYSVSKDVFHFIDKHQPQSPISVHNQESPAEDEYYQKKTGGVRDLLGGFGIDDSFFIPSGKSSLQTYTEWLNMHHTMLFIHNTCTTREDLQVAQHRFSKTFWCLCPNANLYIENRLPDVDMFVHAGADICIGTDSLASNHQLCVLSELITLKKNFQHLQWEDMLRWATMNGARALDMQNIIGSFEEGKQPGIVNIRNLDSEQPQVQRIV